MKTLNLLKNWVERAENVFDTEFREFEENLGARSLSDEEAKLLCEALPYLNKYQIIEASSMLSFYFAHN